MTWEPQNGFERSLMRAVKDPAHRPQFYKDLVESEFFIIPYGPPPGPSGTVVLEEGYELRIQPVELDGKLYLPVFSSVERLRQVVQGEVGFIAMNALEFMKITQGSEIVLNPGSEYGKLFTREEIQAILDGSIWAPSESRTMERNTRVVIGQPANYPHELAGALSRLFKRLKDVQRAYLALFYNPEEEEKPHILIGIEVSGNWEQVVSQAGLVARDIEIPNPPVDFMQITGQEGLEEYFRNECKPFYEKRTLRLF